MKNMLKPNEHFDRLCQRYGAVPVCRMFAYQSREEDRKQVDKVGLSQAHTKFSDAGRLIEFVYSTGGMKRDGNVVDQNGWDLTSYRSNPMVLWCHDRTGEPIGRSISEWLGRAAGGKALRGIVEFTPEGLNPQADRIFQYFQTGFLNAVSASWKPLDYEVMSEEEVAAGKYGKTSFYGGINFTRNEYLETSPCPVPADPEALKKRIQEGAVRADDVTMPRLSTEYVFEDGRKTGIFYVDGHEFVPDSRIIVDVAANKKSEEIPQTMKNPFAPITERIAALRSEGYQIETVQFAATKELLTEHNVALDSFFRDVLKGGIVHSTEDIAQDKVLYRVEIPTSGEIDTGSRLRLPAGEFSIQVVRHSMDHSEFGENRTGIGYSVHGDTPISDASWDAGEARAALRKWAGDDMGKYKQGFAAIDGDAKNLTSYKFPHHTISNSALVTVRRGVYAAAQRISQGNSPVAGDAKPHISAHYTKDLKEKPPWSRAIGEFYIDIHEKLRSQLDETEVKELRNSAEQLARLLFGEYALPEPWQQQRGDDTAAGLVYSTCRTLLMETYADEDAVDEIMSARMDGVFTVFRDLQRDLASREDVLREVAKGIDFPLKDFSAETLRSLVEKTGSQKAAETTKIIETGQRILSLIGEPAETPAETVDNSFASSVDRILQLVEDRSNPSRGQSASDSK